jgi:hypothetical protein
MTTLTYEAAIATAKRHPNPELCVEERDQGVAKAEHLFASMGTRLVASERHGRGNLVKIIETPPIALQDHKQGETFACATVSRHTQQQIRNPFQKALGHFGLFSPNPPTKTYSVCLGINNSGEPVKETIEGLPRPVAPGLETPVDPNDRAQLDSAHSLFVWVGMAAAHAGVDHEITHPAS